MKPLTSLTISLLTSSLLIFSGCSDSDNNSDEEEVVIVDEPILENPLTGYVVDSGVAGLSYTCDPSGANGITGVDGNFTCDDGESVSFSICGQSLGSMTTQEYITPSVIFPGDEEASLNLAQLLQSLDKDSDPSNGIELDISLCSSFTQEISFTSPDFDEDIQKILTEHNKTLVDETNATKHLNDTFVTLDIDEDGTDRVYTWIEGEWGTCAGACGTDNATQTRAVTCEDSIGTQDASKCDAETKPGTSQSCTASECDTTTPPPTPTPAPNQAPVFTSSANVSVEENNETAITLVATDADNDDINYTISEGDSASFDVNTTTGVVTFKTGSLPDFESTKRTYLFTATATDTKSASTTQDVNISITDVADKEHFHNGIKYGEIVSSATSKVWLDRNLGASQACDQYRSSFASDGEYTTSQSTCFGDYYQWGRNIDGHEKSNSDTNTTLATNINTVGLPQEGQFIPSLSAPYDWVGDGVDNDGAARQTYWSSTDGSAVCPNGFRVPTIAELEAENISDRDDAFTKLKLPSAGHRFNDDGSLHNQGSNGLLWSSSVSGSRSSYLNFHSGNASTYSYVRAYGFSVRCLRD